MIAIANIDLTVRGLEELRAEALSEGYNYIETLFDDWTSAENRFDATGEVFCGVFDQDVLVAVGGLNLDPFAGDSEIGRVRRVYVRAGWRDRGIGRALVMHLVGQARPHFKCVRLRAENNDAARLYERLGFIAIDHPDATHIMEFDQIQPAH